MAVEVLLVPIYLDALYLKTDRSASSAMADFTRMPYYDGVSDVNPDIANISEEILSQPFEPPNLQLKAGIHLHWALPDALTRGYQLTERSPIIFPSVPNRWLITRTDKTGRTQWIVESDFLATSGTLNPNGGINYPHISNNRSQPYGFLGRKLLLADWLQERVNTQDKGQYLNNLTAVGYGEPTFAAFYPNCLSVFGFHDETPPTELADVQYNLVGWYSQAEKDCLTFMAQIEAFAELPIDKLKEAYKWQVSNKTDTDPALQRTLCYAQLTFAPEGSTDYLPEQRDVAVAIGNTSTEALSAYLSNYCSRDESLKQKFANPEHLEDQLEAVQLAGRLEGKQIDIGPKFLEARHNKEFTGVQGGTQWIIRQESAQPAHANAHESAKNAQTTLPLAVAAKLHDLNKKQLAYDQDCDDLESLRKQLFADWYKYMLCVYPPEGNRDNYPNLDEVKYFIEKNSLFPLQKRISENNVRKLKLDRALNYLSAELKRLNASDKKKQTSYLLKPVPAPRFWQPNEPVLLLVDEADKTVKPSQRHGQDGVLECHLISLPNTVIENHFETILTEISNLKPGKNKECIGFSRWTRQPWHPFLLEWEVEVMPLRGKYQDEDLDPIHLRPLTRNFDSDCIKDNYQLDEKTVDFGIRPGKEAIIREKTRYSGRSILTPHAKSQTLNQIKLFLETQLVDDYYIEANVKPEDRSNDYFEKNIGTIIDWAYSKNNAAFNQILSIYEFLKPETGEDREFHILAQSLSGFNDALQMQKQTLQLPIDDPLGFDEYRSFTTAVGTAIDNSNRVAPQPHNDFNPIRTGVLKINQLRLVDTFGQVQKINVQEKRVITTDAMTTPSNPHLTVLPPRIVQPARIQFRWLAADETFTLEENNDPEMNSHPASTPICGWLLPNHLDNSLMVYDAQGRALGSLNNSGQWQAAPGENHLIATWPLSNPHLHRVVVYLIQKSKQSHQEKEVPYFLDYFMTVIENALDHIEPENAAQHESLALLIGRPVAVVRARLNLELKGLPVIDQSWSAFQQDMERANQGEIKERETGDFTRVEFPIRIGEYKQLNDGLVGYWIEQEGSEKFDKFYAPQAELEAGITHSDILLHQDKKPIQLNQSISSPPQTLTMLIDPRGCVHATSGVLPTKSIQIPAEQFTEALHKMEITFLTAPILTERGKINLPLPDEPGYAWSWLEKENGAWANVTNIGQISSQATLTANLELREGWLKLAEREPKDLKHEAQGKEQ